MTDKPTLSLDSAEWRAMLGHNLNRAVEFVNQSSQITAEHVTAFHAHLDRMKALVSAWHLSAPAMAADAPIQQQTAAAPVVAKGNGEAPKKRGGWPLGKKRKQRLTAGAQGMQS